MNEKPFVLNGKKILETGEFWCCLMVFFYRDDEWIEIISK
jgi:hypothetical protein